jgi:hypothetical protein
MRREIVSDQPEWVRRNKKYNFRTMVVGELMTIEPNEQGCKDIRSFRALVHNRAKQLGYVLSCRECANGAWEVYRSE